LGPLYLHSEFIRSANNDHINSHSAATLFVVWLLFVCCASFVAAIDVGVGREPKSLTARARIGLRKFYMKFLDLFLCPYKNIV
jgi:hypothetical protein